MGKRGGLGSWTRLWGSRLGAGRQQQAARNAHRFGSRHILIFLVILTAHGLFRKDDLILS
jgi:hypothetical protein